MGALRVCGDSIRVVHPLFPVEGGGSIPTSPLQLVFGWIPIKTAVRLNELWHSRLPDFRWPLDKCQAIGAEYAGLFYAAAIWSHPVARNLNHQGAHELRRLAIAPEAPKNTATRMLRVMRLMIVKRFPMMKRLISYQDVAVHSGTIYKAAGWEPVKHERGGDWHRSGRQSRHNRVSPKVRWEYAL